jgi:hypothetical protein
MNQVRSQLIRLLTMATLAIMTGSPFMVAQDQQPPAKPAPAKSLADVARENRGEKAAPIAPETKQPAKSLGQLAQEQRSHRQIEVKLSDNEGKELLSELDVITEFASTDTGMPKHNPIKHQIVAQQDVKLHYAAALSGSAEAQRLARSELVLKKFGYLPKDFTMKKFMVDSAGESIAGFYDFRTKTMNLVNWIALDQQRPIMAHELTHALQDQNFDLMAWESRGIHKNKTEPMKVDADQGLETIGRRAVIEGQAMVVYLDYLLKPYSVTLANTPAALDYVRDRLTDTYDTSFVVKNAPLLFKDSAIFPYREGLMFEVELLGKGGIKLAFPDTFARPPLDTHQVLEPKAYLENEKIAAVVIPDLVPLLGDKYEAYDTGSMGQLDVRVMSQQFGTENDMFTITPGWKGGSYVAVRRKSVKEADLTTSDLALLYVSRWKTAETAERFAEVYKKSLAKRVSVNGELNLDRMACTADRKCALWAQRVDTNEGPVFIEIWPNHTVFISHSFDDATVGRLRQTVLFQAGGSNTAAAGPELNQTLTTLPGFNAFSERVEREILNNVQFPY